MRKLRRRFKEEKGAALVWVAGSLVTLLAASAFAVDLGWIYLNNSRLQSAADAAALAGVVNLPGFTGQATADASTAAGVNGFEVPTEASLTDEILADNEYKVELTADVQTFFLRVLGFDTIGIRQDATAQYIKPVKLGSPSNQFGGPSVNFWASITGRYTEIQQGDPYASQCITHNAAGGPAGCSGATNPEYRPEGYFYAVEVGPGSSDLSVQFYDGGHYIQAVGCPTGGSGSGTSGPSDTSWRPCWSNRGVNLEYILYEPDTTPSDPTDNTIDVCSDTFPSYFDSSLNTTQQNNGHFNKWTGNNNCSVSGGLTEGIYVLQLPSPLYEGSSKFGIRANVGTGPAPKVYGLLDMSIHVNFTSGVAEPYLAEVRPEHAGKTLEVDIWDLGDAPGDQDDASITFFKADGDQPDCAWESTNGESDGSVADCYIEIGAQRFNAEWLNVSIPIPPDYTCNPDGPLPACWWKIHIESNAQPTDRTTWTARITGDPVRLID